MKNEDSINMDELNELTPVKMIETTKAKNVIINAILLGIQKAINRRGKEYNIPPSVTMNIVKEVQNGGGRVFNALNTAGDIYNYKKTAAKELENLGLDKKTAQQLRSASTLGDVKNIGIKRLKEFGNVPPPPQGFGSRTLKSLKKNLGLIKEEPETLTKDDLRRIGVEGLRRFGVTKRIGITDEQLNDLNTISPNKITQLGKLVAIDKLKKTGVLDKLGMTEQELQSLNISQIKTLGKELATQKLKTRVLGNFGMSEEQLQNMTSDHLKQTEIEKFKRMAINTNDLTEGFSKAINPNNPDYKQDTGELVVNKIAANAKNMYIGLIKKIIIAVDFFASKIIDTITHDALNTPISELTENTNKRVLVLAAYLRELANNPEQLKAIEEISESLGIMGIEFIDTIKPSIDKIVDKLIKSSQEVGSKAASGFMKTFIAIGTSIIAVIPGIGGVIDMLISIAIGFNSFMRVVRTFIESNSEVAVYSAELAGKTIGTVRRNTDKIMEMVDRLKSIPNGVPSSIQTNQLQNGGNVDRRYGNSDKMTKSRKRIENSVLRFKKLYGEKKYNCHSHCSRTRKHIYY